MCILNTNKDKRQTWADNLPMQISQNTSKLQNELLIFNNNNYLSIYALIQTQKDVQ